MSEQYDRQILLFGEEAQQCHSESKVFIAGAGGLGSPVSIYLAIAGIGTIIIADCDTVSLSNLNRQFLHTDANIGRKKVDSARSTLEQLNTEIEIITYSESISEENIGDMTADCTLTIDCLDNFKTRFILNQTALEKKIPLIHGAVTGRDGQTTTILPRKTPCLACLFPNPPPRELSFPIVGTTAGVIGSMQANEAIRILTGNGATMADKLLIWDGRSSSLDEMAIERNESCPVCSAIKQ